MRRSSRPTGTPANLPESAHQQLNMYVLAAGAAGVGVLALAQAAEAKIVYTKANLHIGPNATLYLDLNHDNVADFDLKNSLYTFSNNSVFFSTGRLSAIPDRQKNAVWGANAYASALPAKVKVGPKGQFLPAGGLMASTSSYGGLDRHAGRAHGPWVNVTNRYLGLKFVIKGKIHFGWARLNVICGNARVNATLTGYAYETIPNKPIITGQTKGPDDISIEEPDASLTMPAPEPATLGALAMGAPGLSIWRREELEQAAAPR